MKDYNSYRFVFLFWYSLISTWAAYQSSLPLTVILEFAILCSLQDSDFPFISEDGKKTLTDHAGVNLVRHAKSQVQLNGATTEHEIESALLNPVVHSALSIW